MKDSKLLYKTVNKLTGKDEERIYPSFDSDQNLADAMTSFYSDKILKIREELSLKNSDCDLHLNPEITFDGISELTDFKSLNPDELITLVSQMNSKSSILDPAPTKIVKQCLDLLTPIILHIINTSLASNSFPQSLKHASVSPIIKDKEKNSQDFKNYRPVSNLPFLSKLLEKVALKEINAHLTVNKLHSKFQSGYRKHHSCETSMFKVVGDIQNITSKRSHVAMLLLDLSSAFDALDHDILLKRLEQHFGIKGNVLDWLCSYLTKRTFSVSIKGCLGQRVLLLFGVPQGSLLGPLLFIMYCKQIENIALKYGLLIQLYADDSQIYVEIRDGSNVTAVKCNIEACLEEIKIWMSTNFMKLNESKTKLITYNPPRRPYNVPISDPSYTVQFDNCILEEVISVKALGVTLTPDLNFKSFIVSKSKSCNFQLYNLRHIKNSLNTSLRFMLVNSLILTQIDYCNSILAACPQKDIFVIQKVVNNSVRFVFDIKRNAHITPYLVKLHLLPVKYRILFKLCVLAYKVVNKIAPGYLLELFNCYEPTLTMSLRYGVGRDSLMLMYKNGLQLPFKCVFTKLIKSWNELPLDLRFPSTMDSFKKKLKTFYFKKAYADYI